MSKAIFVDTTTCTACRGCQIACKQWHGLPAEQTTNRGTFENPADLSFNTYKIVRMREEVIDGKLNWLFFPEQCRHCLEPPCRDIAQDESSIFRNEQTGAVIFTANSKNLDAQEITDACPYNIPRAGADGTLAKCDMCNDRVENGLLPTCVQTCPTGAMSFGDLEEMRDKAKKRLEVVKQKYPKAMLLDPDDVSVIYLVAFEPKYYHEFAVASRSTGYDMTRKMALRKMFRPLANIMSSLT